MSALSTQLAVATAALVESEARQDDKLRGLDVDLRSAVEAIHRHQLTEKIISDGRHEMLMKRLEDIARTLGTNGTGGDHG